MGGSISKVVQPVGPSLADVLIEAPALLDLLDSRSLRALARSSKDLRQVVDHPQTWKNNFAKGVGINPGVLPAPPQHLSPTLPSRATTLSNMTPPFKMLCQGLAAVQYIAENPSTTFKPDKYHQILIGTIDQYLQDNMDSVLRNLDERTAAAHRYASQRKFYLGESACWAGGSCMFGAGAASSVVMLTKVETAVATVPTAKMAALIGSLGVKGAKIYLYTLVGFTTTATIGMTGLCAYASVSALTTLHREHQAHKNSMRQLRIAARINAGRQNAERLEGTGHAH